MSLERLRLEPGLALYRHKRAARRDGEPFDPAELLARLLMHIPAPRPHLVRYYGRYSPDDELSRAERRRLRRGWAQLIRRVYETDPLLCKCGEKVRIPSFITDPPVVTKILEHLRRTRRDPSRAPPSATDAPVALAS